MKKAREFLKGLQIYNFLKEIYTKYFFYILKIVRVLLL